MPKSKSNKKRKKKVIAFKAKLHADKKRFRETFIKGLEEAHAKEMEEKVKSGQAESEVEGLGEFSLDNQNTPIEQPVIEGLSELGLGDVQQVELTGAPPDSFSGVIK